MIRPYRGLRRLILLHNELQIEKLICYSVLWGGGGADGGGEEEQEEEKREEEGEKEDVDYECESISDDSDRTCAPLYYTCIYIYSSPRACRRGPRIGPCRIE